MDTCNTRVAEKHFRCNDVWFFQKNNQYVFTYVVESRSKYEIDILLKITSDCHYKIYRARLSDVFMVYEGVLIITNVFEFVFRIW